MAICSPEGCPFCYLRAGRLDIYLARSRRIETGCRLAEDHRVGGGGAAEIKIGCHAGAGVVGQQAGPLAVDEGLNRGRIRIVADHAVEADGRAVGRVAAIGHAVITARQQHGDELPMPSP